MSDVPEPLDEEDLHGFADGQLSPERMALVRAWIGRDPVARDQVENWRRQNKLIRQLHGRYGPELLPTRLRPELMRRGRRRMLQRMTAAVVVGLLAGGGAGWLARGLDRNGSDEAFDIALEAARAYRNSTNAVSFEKSLVGESPLSTWLEEQLGHHVPVPDLSGVGLRLLGGSVLAGGHSNKAIQLVYEDPGQVWFTLYMSWGHQPEPSEFRFVRMEEVNGFYWPQDELRCVLTADSNPDYMLDIARFTYDQMQLEEIASRLLDDDQLRR